MNVTLTYNISFIKSCLEARIFNRLTLSCTGNEEHLLNCSFTQENNCWNGEDASVNCTVAECTEGAVDLVGGINKTEGRVEICLFGYWSEVSDSYSPWTYKVARVVCKQLGYSYSGILMIVFKPV